MKLNNYYQKNLIFQQGKSFVVKGISATSSLDVYLKRGNEIIKPELHLNGDGCFNAIFAPLEASNDHYTLIAHDKDESMEISPIYCGDVYLSLGQSNMSLPLKLTEDKDKYLKKAKKHNSAYLVIEDSYIDENDYVYRPDEPLNDINSASKWRNIKEDASNYSALSYILLSMLDDKVDYPIGIVISANGGLSIDSFLPLEDIKNNKDIKDYLIKTNKYSEKEEKHSFISYTRTSGVYNEKVAPLVDVKFKSIIYYQGENSAYDFASAIYFETAIKILIDSYRDKFKDNDLPFFLMGIADEYYCYGDDYGYPYITEALSNIDKDNVYLVPIYDIKPKWLVKDGNFINHPIHTSNKEKYTKRLFDIIYRNLYKREKYLPPKVKKVELLSNQVLLEIETFDGKLRKNTSFEGFYVASKEGIYKKAHAIAIDDNHILLSSNLIKDPCYYLYGLYQYSYLANCILNNGLPLLPSRSIKEKMDRVHYHTNTIFGCDVLRIIENNFGADTGGGFPIKLWDKGDIYPLAHVHTSLNKKDKIEGQASIEVRVKLNKSCFGFFSIKANIGCAGQFHALGVFPYLNIDIKGDKDVSFYGILFRVNGRINKFPIYDIEGQCIELQNDWRTYSIDLNKILDGSNGITNISKEVINSLSSMELYFRTEKDKTIVLIDNLNLSFKPVINRGNKKEKGHVESSIQLPGIKDE